MSTRVVIARDGEREGEFTEVYHHADSYPAGLGACLRKFLRRYFQTNLTHHDLGHVTSLGKARRNLGRLRRGHNLGGKMKRFLFVPAIVFLFPLNYLSTSKLDTDSILNRLQIQSRPVPDAAAMTYSALRSESFEVAKVFGRASGCQDATPEFINQVTTDAVGSGLDPRIAASTIAVESACNPMAISSKGAVGYMQVRPTVWKSGYDFSKVNLLNPSDNLRVGIEILAGLVSQYGLADGLHRYNGTGVGCKTCDADYVPRILALARWQKP